MSLTLIHLEVMLPLCRVDIPSSLARSGLSELDVQIADAQDGCRVGAAGMSTDSCHSAKTDSS